MRPTSPSATPAPPHLLHFFPCGVFLVRPTQSAAPEYFFLTASPPPCLVGLPTAFHSKALTPSPLPLYHASTSTTLVGDRRAVQPFCLSCMLTFSVWQTHSAGLSLKAMVSLSNLFLCRSLYSTARFPTPLQALTLPLPRPVTPASKKPSVPPPRLFPAVSQSPDV
jgi:hypothetical protein